jgi:two-component system cell cycle response regulator
MARASNRDLEALLAVAERRVADLERRDPYVGIDPVTGLPDVREFCEKLELELERARRYERPLSLALLDLDGFGAICDEHGKRAGARVLKSVAGALTGYLRVHDVACRAWSDEFAILLPETGIDGAMQALGRINLELSVIEAGPVHGISASIGLTARRTDESAVALLGAASRALDRARAVGGRCVAVAPVAGGRDAAKLQT